jgi:hypothetical protein
LRPGLVFVALGAIGAVTLVPSQDAGLTAASFWCVACGESGIADFIANALLFVPLGWSLHLNRVRLLSSMLVIVGTTCLVEALQHGVVPGRTAALSDVLANTVGGAIGIVSAGLVRAGARNHRVQVGVVAAITLVALVVMASTPAVLRLPVQAPAGWQAGRDDVPGHVPFPGSNLAVLLGPEARGVGRGAATIDVSFVTRALIGQRAQIVSLLTRDGATWGWIDQCGRGVCVYVLTPADRLGLRGRDLRLPGVLSAGRVERVRVEIRTSRSAVSLTADVGMGRARTGSRVSPLSGWRLLLPAGTGRVLALALAGLWAGALCWPFGHVARLGGARVGMIGAGLVAVGLSLSAAATGGGPPSVAEGIGAVIGFGAGCLPASVPRTHPGR